MLLLLLMLLSTLGLAAPQVGHRAWDVRDGLPVNGVQDVLLGPDGYIWVATIGGAWRFDGVRFTKIDTGPGGPPRVVSLASGEGDLVWMHTEQDEVIGVDSRTGQTSRFEAQAWQVARDGRLFVVDAGRLLEVSYGVARFVDNELLEGVQVDWVLHLPEVGTWVLGGERLIFLAPGGGGRKWALAELGVVEATALLEDPQGRGWLAGTGGLFRLPTDPEGAGAEPEPLRVEGKVWGAEAVAVLEEEGTVWVALPDGLWPWRAEQLGAPVAGDRGRPPDGQFQLESTGGHTWTATRTAVLLDGEVVHRLEAGDGVVAITLDHEDALWLATRRSGLHRLQPALFGSIGLAQGLRSDNVYSLAEARGALWIGGQYTWLSRIAGEEHTWQGPEAGLPKDVVAILGDEAGRLWVGAHADGLFVQEEPGDTFTHVGELGLCSVQALALLGDGTLLVGSDEGLYAQREGRWERLDEAWGLPGGLVRAVAEEADGTLWLGTNRGGLVRRRSGKSEVWGADSALGTDRVRWVQPVEGGAWVGTEDQGLVWVHDAGPSSRRLGPDQGLPDTYVHAVLFDGRGSLWGNSNQGLFRLDAE